MKAWYVVAAVVFASFVWACNAVLGLDPLDPHVEVPTDGADAEAEAEGGPGSSTGGEAGAAVRRHEASSAAATPSRSRS